MIPRPTRRIAQKVMFVVLATTFIALLATVVAMSVYDSRVYREAWLDDIRTQADIIARVSAPAMQFEDRQAASDTLALLSVRPTILAGAIYTVDGDLYARYTHPDSRDIVPVTAPTREFGYTLSRDRLFFLQEIREGSERLGSVYLIGRHDLSKRLFAYGKILALMMLCSLLLAALIGMWLQRSVTQPLSELTDVARNVIQHRDYSLRAGRTTEDEVGELVDSFNAMLAEVQRNADALRIADKRKDEFIATLAHELRNPLAPLANGLEILRVSSADKERSRLVRDMMQRQLKQLVRLVDDLLDVSRITTGRLTIKRERIELHSVLTDAIEIARPIIEGKEHRLAFDIAADKLTVEGDATRLAQVFSNLLNNAACYTPPRGQLRLEARVDEDQVIVSVADNGIGLTKESLATIFGMFTQVDRSLERTTAGLGVGLSLAQRLIELHDGTLQAESAGLGQGSRFVVRLPRARVAPAAQTPDILADAQS